jgi:hypothetical protein
LRFTRLPLLLAFAWLAIRWTLSMKLDAESAKNAGVLINILFILLIIFLSINAQYRGAKQKTSSFLEDFKVCMKPALVYVLCSVVFIGIFYAWLSDDIEELRNAHINHFNEGIKDENNLANFLIQHPEENGKSVEELMQKNRDNVERNISVQTWVMGGSLALTMVAAAYSVLAVFFWRTFVRKW